MGNLELLEHAFRVAETGDVENVAELRDKLQEEGVPRSDLDQFKGASLRDAAFTKIKRSRKQVGAGIKLRNIARITLLDSRGDLSQ